MSDSVLPCKSHSMEKLITSLSPEDVEEIAETSGFSGFFYTPSETNQALETEPSTNPSVVVETKSSGNIDQLLGVYRSNQIELEEPQANSTLLDPAEEPAEPASAEAGEAESEAGKEGPKPSDVDRRERKRAKRRLTRQRKKLTRSLSKLTTDQNGQGSHAEPSTTQPPVTVDPPAAKRGKNSPGETSEAQRPRREESNPVQLSFAEAAKKAIFINFVPLDSRGNEIRATAGDRRFIVEKLEQFIARCNPNINITDFSLRGKYLRVECLNQKTLDSVKRVVCPLKGPRGNLKGYKCLGPGDIPPLVTYSVWVETPVPKKAELFHLFKDANDWVNLSKMTAKAVIPKKEGATFLIGVTPEIKAELEKRNFQLRYGVGRTANFKTKPKGHQSP